MDPKGHAAIVTGAASGLGAETAAHLARAGVKVACLDINIDGARETADKIGGIAIRCDVTSSDNAETAPSRKSALGQESASRNSRAKLPRLTSEREMASTTVSPSRTPTPLRI